VQIALVPPEVVLPDELRLEVPEICRLAGTGNTGRAEKHARNDRDAPPGESESNVAVPNERDKTDLLQE